jgi:peptidoglycan/xylan/chitin deacetylase (PgdA/CDA1 family)/LysM repeat protein
VSASPSTSPISTASPSASPTPSATPTARGETEATDTPPPPTPAPTVIATATVAPPVATTYAVQRGDTVYSIARRYGTTVAQIQAWNAERYPALGRDASVLETGWVLVVAATPGVTPAPTPRGTPTATTRPSPAATPPAALGCTAGNRVAAGSAQTFRTIPNAGRAVALTFDMGGRMDPAVEIMNFLVANRVCATIFATGVMSQTPRGLQVMAIIKAHPELFEIANHTMYHCDLVRGGGGSPTTPPCAGGAFTADRVRRELLDADAVLRAGTGQSPQPYWRPPYGSVNAAVIEAAASAGYTKTFLWDIDTVDWKPVADGGPTAAQIASKVITQSVNGSNVLFHLGGYETLDALRIIVPGLRDRGLTPTSLSDLLR